MHEGLMPPCVMEDKRGTGRKSDVRILMNTQTKINSIT